MKKEPKQETLEESLQFPLIIENGIDYLNFSRKIFNNGAKWQQERSYSEEDLIKVLHQVVNDSHCTKDRIKQPNSNKCAEFVIKWFEQFKKK